MKLSGLLFFVCLAPLSSFAQQRSAADAFANGFATGRAIRQAADARKAAQEKEQAAQEKERQERLFEELDAAYDNPSSILKSRNGLPDIVISRRSVSICSGGAVAAFTRDSDNKFVYGCAMVGANVLSVIWDGYGSRTYMLAEWEVKQPLDADHGALGAK